MVINLNKVEIKVKLTIKDYFDFQLKGIQRIFFSLSNIKFLLTIFVVLLPAFIYIRVRIGEDALLEYFLIACDVNVAYFLISIIDARITSKKYVENHSVYSNEISKEITKEGVLVFFKGSEFHMDWKECVKIYESKYLFKLVQDDGKIILITKASFKKDDELKFFSDCTKNIKKH